MITKRIGRVLRLVGRNIVLIVCAWLGVLLVTAVAADVYSRAMTRWPPTDRRIKLPNYPDKERARRLFADYKKTIEEYVPFLGWQRLPLTTEFANIREDGIRMHRAGTENNDPDAATIGFFGGSTMWGTGVDDDSTIPAIFDQLTTGYAVTNYSESGHNARQMLARLMNLIDTRQMPDIVIFYGGFNHIWTHCNYAVTHRLNGHMIERKIQRRLTEHPRWGYVYANIVAPPLDFFRRIIGEKRFIRNDYACQDDPVRAEQVAEAFLRIAESANVLTEHWGGRFHAFLQPVAYIGEPRLDHSPRLIGGGGEQIRAVYPLIQAKAKERAASWFTDLSNAFNVDEQLYIDDAHVTRNGNGIIAERILARLSGDRPLPAQRLIEGVPPVDPPSPAQARSPGQLPGMPSAGRKNTEGSG